MATAARLMTANELLLMPDVDSCRYELLNGELITMPPSGSEHSAIRLDFGAELRQFVKANDLGRVFGADCGFIICADPDTVLSPDVSFVRKERIPADGLPKGFFPGPPDIAIEVISPSDNYTEVERKAAQLLDAGTLLVVLIDPRAQTVVKHPANGTIASLTESDTLTLGEALPGFELPVSDIFR